MSKQEAGATLGLLLLLTAVSFGHLAVGGQPFPTLLRNNLYVLLGGRHLAERESPQQDPLVAVLSQENQRLHEQLSLRARLPGEARVAQVVRREPETWWGSLEVEFAGSPPSPRGTAVVLTSQGLIGSLDGSAVTIVGEGDRSFCRGTVVLLSSPESQLSVVVGETQAPFLLQGRGGDLFTLKPVTSGAERAIAAGDSVLTSGLGQLYSQGLKVGLVTRDGKGATFSPCAFTPSEVVLWWR